MFQFKLYNNVTGGITCSIDGKVYQADKSHPGYSKLLKAFKENNSDIFTGAYDLSQYVKATANGKASGLEVVGDKITYNGKDIDPVIKDYIIALREDGFEIDYVLRFLENLYKNPSGNSVKQFFSFLSHRNMPIDTDGNIMAYKAVTAYQGQPFIDAFGRNVNPGDYVDKYTRSIRNNIGDVVYCERNEVDDNPNNECSYGYHVGALAYSGPGGYYNTSDDVCIIVKVNPEDVVAVPRDYNAQKVRVCRYEVISVFKNALGNSAYGAPIYENNKSWYEENEDDECDNEDCSCHNPF